MIEEVRLVPGHLLWVLVHFPYQSIDIMSFRDCLCDPDTRDMMAQGVVKSVNVVGMDMDAYEELKKFGEKGSVVAKNYL